jgi:hypothetical protein
MMTDEPSEPWRVSSKGEKSETVNRIETLRATLEEACWKKGRIFFQLVSTLFCEVERGFVDL